MDTSSAPRYWLLQANPAKGQQIIEALKARLLKSWMVTALAAEIRDGDKVVLWLNGNASGIYALATIGADTSANMLEEAEVDYFTDKELKAEAKRLRIKLDYNLVEQPLHKEQLQKTPELKRLKISKEVSTLALKEAQYQAVLDLIKTNNKNPIALNSILYGPPGTGKTYNAVNYALSIVANVDIEVIEHLEKLNTWKNAVELFRDLPSKSKRTEYKNGRELLKDIFDYCCEQGQIIFTTFHQSMSYEDFIEGIKPMQPKTEGGNLYYDIENGLFKRIARLAASNYENAKEKNKGKMPFEEALQCLRDDWENEPDMKFAMKKIGAEFTVSAFSSQQIAFKKANSEQSHRFNINTLKALYYGIKEVDFSSGSWSYYYSILSKINSYNKVSQKRNALKNFVIIIDEINRGNISQIFGELITLIEEDKRMGKSEALEVLLPYSKEPFGIAPNLYIIGTMNTADRSVEALDTALRRRFNFMEMPARPELLTGSLHGIKLSTLLQTLNKRIEKLVGKDQQIGHSYFMQLYTISDLKSVFYHKIIPLLQEYFYGDYGKIGMILGEGFFAPFEKRADDLFADFFDYDGQAYQDRIIYSLLNVSKMTDLEFENALRKMLKMK